MTKFQRVEAFKAGADLTGLKHRIVKLGSASNEVVLCGNGEAGIGVLMSENVSGGVVEVAHFGGDVEVMGGATLAAGAQFASDATGKAKAPVAGNVVLGIMAEAVVSDEVARAHMVAPVVTA